MKFSVFSASKGAIELTQVLEQSPRVRRLVLAALLVLAWWRLPEIIAALRWW